MGASSKDRFTTFSFFSFGLWTGIPHMVILWSAVEDILAGNLLPTTVIVISFSVPDILSKILSPFMVSRIPFYLSFALFTLLSIGPVLLLVVVDDVKLRIVGVGVQGIANGLATIMIVRMIAYYEQAKLFATAYQNGNCVAAFLSSLGYAGLTTWLCVPPRTAVAACIPVGCMPLVFYALIDKEPIKNRLSKETLNHKDVKYTPLEDTEQRGASKPSPKSIHKLLFIFKVFPFVVYTYISLFCMQFSLTAVLSTLVFPSSPFRSRDHYQYYRLLSETGILCGGIVSFIGHKWIQFFRIDKIWVLVLLNVGHLLFFVFASWYRFLTHVIVVLVLCFTQGVVTGSSFVECLACAANLFSCAKDNGTALGLVELGMSFGRIAAGLLGVFTESLLREHCMYLELSNFCLSRHSSYAGWTESLNC